MPTAHSVLTEDPEGRLPSPPPYLSLSPQPHQQHVRPPYAPAQSLQSEAQSSSSSSSTTTTTTTTIPSSTEPHMTTVQYSIAIVQGMTLYLLSVVLSFMQLVQCKISERILIQQKGRGFEGQRPRQHQWEERQDEYARKTENRLSGQGQETRGGEGRQGFWNFGGNFMQSLGFGSMIVHRVWAFMCTALRQGQDTITPQDPVAAANGDQGRGGEGYSLQDEGISKRFRRALVRTLSGHLVPQNKKVTFRDAEQVILLDPEQEPEKIQEQELWSRRIGFSGANTTMTPLKEELRHRHQPAPTTSTHPVYSQTTAVSSGSNSSPQKTANSAATSELASAVLPSLVAPAAPSALKSNVATKTFTYLPVSTGQHNGDDDDVTNVVGADHGLTVAGVEGGQGEQNSHLKRSSSAPSKTSTFLQRYRQNKQQQQKTPEQGQQEQPLLLRSNDTKGRGGRRYSSSSGSGPPPPPSSFAQVIASQATVTQHAGDKSDALDLTAPASSPSPGVPAVAVTVGTTSPPVSLDKIASLSVSTSSSSPSFSITSLGTRARRSLSLVRPRPQSCQLQVTGAQRPALVHRRSLDSEPLKTVSTPTAAVAMDQQQQQQEHQQQQGVRSGVERPVSTEHRNFMYKIAHPQRYKREIEQRHQQQVR